MPDGSKIYFKATRDNLLVIMDPVASFDEIKSSLSIKAGLAKRFFGDSNAFIIFKGRPLSDEEEAQLVKIMEDETDLRIFITHEKEKSGEMHDFQGGFSRSMDFAIIPPFPMNGANIAEQMPGAVFHKGSLRSGMSIESEGSVIVIGDVNPGGEVIAGGNIIVLGAMKGLAHAGACGDEDSFVAALSLQPVQLRIANMIAAFDGEQGKFVHGTPSYAYILDDRIYIEPLI